MDQKIRVKNDFEKILSHLIDFAKEMIEKYGEFHPFAAVIDANGKIIAEAAWSKDNKEDLVEILIDGLKHQARYDNAIGVGVCTNTSISRPDSGEKSDAITVELEHKLGEPIIMHLPYKKQSLGRVEYDNIFATSGTTRIFGE